MDRRTTIVATLAAAAALAGAGLGLAKPPAARSKGEPSANAPSLHVRAFDLPKRSVLIEISGVQKPPPPNFFTFTDERARKFVAPNIHCEEPFPSGTRACNLEIPAGYERHRPVSLVFHLRGLHDKPITAEESELASAWAAALATFADAGAP